MTAYYDIQELVLVQFFGNNLRKQIKTIRKNMNLLYTQSVLLYVFKNHIQAVTGRYSTIKSQ